MLLKTDNKGRGILVDASAAAGYPDTFATSYLPLQIGPRLKQQVAKHPNNTDRVDQHILIYHSKTRYELVHVD